jgi:hypothetical protein
LATFFLGRRPTSKIPVRKNFEDLSFFFFSNFAHCNPPPHHEPSIPLSTPLAWAPITRGVGPHPTFRGVGLQPPTAPPVYAPALFCSCQMKHFKLTCVCILFALLSRVNRLVKTFFQKCRRYRLWHQNAAVAPPPLPLPIQVSKNSCSVFDCRSPEVGKLINCEVLQSRSSMTTRVVNPRIPNDFGIPISVDPEGLRDTEIVGDPGIPNESWMP